MKHEQAFYVHMALKQAIDEQAKVLNSPLRVSNLIGIQGIVADMAKLMKNAIDLKRKKLLTKDQDILKHCAGAVLLLYGAYGCSEAKHARSAFQEVLDYDWFHTIFIATPVWHTLGIPTDGERKHREGLILFTKESAWLGTNRISA